MRIVLILLISMGYLSIQAQNITLSGNVINTEKEALTSASVVLSAAADSTFITFGLTNSDGRFKIGNVKPMKYILQVTYMGYDQINEILDLSEKTQDYDIGDIRMKYTNNELEEVVINGETTPIMVKKDTLEYNAAAFETRPQDVVEDLLRKMPGVEVEDDGTVIAQGEEVERVTVDGKDFFGKDPKVATKNIAAKAVKSVQFYDRKSDMSEFTGVDDGEREKTMNLELKEEYRSGYFGNAGIAGGSKGRYEGNLNLNRFGPKSQISIIGNFNNINKQGFSTDQFMNFMNSMGGFGGRGRGGSIDINRGLSDGFVHTKAGGININYDFSDKTELNFSYFLNDIENTTDKKSTRETFINESRSFLSNSEYDQLSSNTGHTFRIKLEHEIDSTQNIRLESNISTSRSYTNSESFSNVISNGREQNNSNTDYLYDGANDRLSGDLLYRKKLNKSGGRSITLSGALNTVESENEGNLDALNNYYEDPAMALAEEIAQNQLDNNDQVNYRIRSSYIEPLRASNYLEMMYRRSNTNNEVIRDVYDVLNGTADLNEALSNHYDRNFVYDQYGMTYHWNGETSTLSVEGLMQHSRLNGELLSEGTTINNNNSAFLPSLRWRKEFDRGHFLRLRYSTNVNEPSLTQLQPIVDNSNPLNIYKGNPDLVPEYQHRVRINYIKFDQFSFSSLFAFINATYTRNNIINQTTIDNQFRNTSTPVNVDYDFNINGNISYSSPIRSLGMKYRTITNLSYRRNILFINENQNLANRYTARVGLTLENRSKKVWDVEAGMNLNYNITKYSENNDRDQSFFNQTYNGSIRFNPNSHWSMESAIRLRIFDEQNFGSTRSVPIWTASISRYFLAGNRGEIMLSAFDLLNQNLGVNQTNTLNYIQNEQVLSLGRYIMFSFKYALRSTGEDKGAGRGGMRIKH